MCAGLPSRFTTVPATTCSFSSSLTSGGSIIETAVELENAGLHIQDLVALLDREQGGKENLSKKYNFHSILSMSDIFNTLLESNLLNPAERSILERLQLEKSA